MLDKDEEPVPNAVIRIVGDDGSNQKEVAKDDGSFKFKLERGVKYVMQAGAKGYLNVKQEFESDMEEEDADYGVDFILAAIYKPQMVMTPAEQSERKEAAFFTGRQLWAATSCPALST